VHFLYDIRAGQAQNVVITFQWQFVFRESFASVRVLRQLIALESGTVSTV
jgi:hypothetical protein